MPKLYKFLKESKGKIVSDYKRFEWEVGKEYSLDGKIELCSNGFHASRQPLQALSYVKGDVIAIVEAIGDKDVQNDKECYRTMKIVKAYKWKAEDSIALAIYAAEQVIKIYEGKYPGDERPREAIKAAKAYLKDPSKKNCDAAAYAAGAAARAAGAAYAADAVYAADAAYAAGAAYAADAVYAVYAADAVYAARAACAAADAADAAAYAAGAAARAAGAAADAAGAAGAEQTAKINRWFKARINKLEEIK